MPDDVQTDLKESRRRLRELRGRYEDPDARLYVSELVEMIALEGHIEMLTLTDSE